MLWWWLFACNTAVLVVDSEREGETAASCVDALDNDGDGFIDCDDQDCQDYEVCASETDGPAQQDTDTIEDSDPSGPGDTDAPPIDTDAPPTDSDVVDADGDGVSLEDGDCDDGDSDVYPGAVDDTVDGIDQNCDQIDGPDADGDGFVDEDAGGDDCDDDDDEVYPGAVDTPNDGVDQDCSGGDNLTFLEDFDRPGEYAWNVPNGRTTLTFGLWGGGGAGGEQLLATGGGGGYVEVTLSVTPGETLTLWVGDGASRTGHGGGASALRRGATWLAIAGGGGGGASDGDSGDAWAGGAGGAGGEVGEPGMDLLYHQVGTTSTDCQSATGGAGATQSSGGAGGIAAGTLVESSTGLSRVCQGTPGASLQGGGSEGLVTQCALTGAMGWEIGTGTSHNGHGGTGGAGYYGGGGGSSVYSECGAGGGGGSSWFTPSAVSGLYMDGVGQTQGNAIQSQGSGRGGDRDYGGASDNGEDGRIVVF